MRAKRIIYCCVGILFFISLGFLLCCSPSDKTGVKPGKVWKDPTLGMEFVWAPGGCYEMGCGSRTSECQEHERPEHTVCVSGFWIGKYEVTQGQWKGLMGDNPAQFNKCGDNCPVEQVSWNDAVDFAERLSRKTGHTFRLPTEAEWEYACRSGGMGEKYSGGDNVDAIAWYTNNSGWKTNRVGRKRSNGLGIYDMSGNVWEWCSDWYANDYYDRSPKDNPQGSSGGQYRVNRGGSWNDLPGYVRCSNRYGDWPDNRYYLMGFRLVRVGQK